MPKLWRLNDKGSVIVVGEITHAQSVEDDKAATEDQGARGFRVQILMDQIVNGCIEVKAFVLDVISPEVGKPIDENSACVEVGKPIDENPACVEILLWSPWKYRCGQTYGQAGRLWHADNRQTVSAQSALNGN
ncbi:hypothetical protein TNCV_53961 [Trichonephila clavipes]|nr:hypothetical protein TNCV_53961 [Trichonephila clavipes]